ncbi:Uncharacterised protein [uncultured archaeon]|nr:Uncharacterised protein [uncultured archaeon]
MDGIHYNLKDRIALLIIGAVGISTRFLFQWTPLNITISQYFRLFDLFFLVGIVFVLFAIIGDMAINFKWRF